jgi:hypothetical protein
MSTKPHTYKIYEILRKMTFCTKGYAEIHIQRPLLGEILGMKIQMVGTCFDACSIYEI